MLLPAKKNELLNDGREIPLLDEQQIKELFDARCSDL